MQNGVGHAADPTGLILGKLQSFVAGFYYQLPNILVGIVLLVVAYASGRLVRRVVRHQAERRNRPDLGMLLGSLASGIILIVAVLFAAAIIFPSVKPADILATLGIGSVAIGFAFKDILQNLLAGILLLIKRPFRQGDQIVVKGFEGTVEHIESRATLIKTYDGRRVIIPNADIYTSPVVVNTAYPLKREEYDIGIGYGDNPGEAARALQQAVAAVNGVVPDPAPEVLPWALDASSVNLRARWWADSTKVDQVHVRSRVILAVFEKAKEMGVDLPFPTQVVLFHDQTEETDGDRTRQREGWPAGAHPPEHLRPARAPTRRSSL